MNKYYGNEKTNHYFDDRFAKLSEKIASISNLEIKCPNKLAGVETKMDYLEVNILRTIKDFEFKSKYLQDEMDFLNKILQEEKSSKEDLRKKIDVEMKNFELKVKSIFETERENIKNFTESLMNTVEEEIIKIYQDLTQEKEEILKSLHSLRNYVDAEIPKLNKSSDENIFRRDEHMKYMVQTINEEMKYLNDLV